LDRETLESRVIIDAATGCWIYMGKDGKGIGWNYARTREKGKSVLLHRWVYQEYVGPIPDGLDIRHSCNRPHCENPAHLRPGTHQDNMDDKVEAQTQHRPIGEVNVKAKLTEDQVRAILKDPRKVSVIAREYGVTRANIHDIRRRDTWKHIDAAAVAHERHTNEKLLPEQVRLIRKDSRTYQQIANDNGVSPQTVCNIKKRRMYSDVA
jgi:uncharacterized protein YerC